MCWIKLLWQSAKEVWVTPALYLSRGPASIAPAEAARMELHRAPQPWSRVQSCCMLAGALWVFCSYSQLCIRMAEPSGALHGLCQSPGVCWVFGYLQVSQDSLDIARLTLASSYPCWSWRAHPGPAATCSSSPKCIAILAHPYTSPHSDISSSCKTSLSNIKIIFFFPGKHAICINMIPWAKNWSAYCVGCLKERKHPPSVMLQQDSATWQGLLQI